MNASMNASPGTVMCPKGHTSAELDYCSECGAKIAGAAPGTTPALPPQVHVTTTCPDCGTPREQTEIAFCEVCGYNFTTGAHGEIPIAPPVTAEPATAAAEDATEEPAEAQQEPAPTAPVHHWTVTASADPALRSADSPEVPADLASFEVVLQSPVSLIGRRNEVRAIFPEISLDHDEAVSRRHALLQLDPERGLLLRDIGAANGTRLNGKELQPMVDHPVQDGDEITLGHWSRLKVQLR